MYLISFVLGFLTPIAIFAAFVLYDAFTDPVVDSNYNEDDLDDDNFDQI